MIRLENINKTYPGSTHAAIGKLNITINEGEFCTFVGPSGCGKTTLLRMINQLDIPDAGSVYVQGIKIADADIIQVRRKIGFDAKCCVIPAPDRCPEYRNRSASTRLE
jgi:osmoprotectant transport system ATP-binding protein